MMKLLHKVKETKKRFVPVLLSTIMTISMCQVNTFAAVTDGDHQKDMNERIETLLSAGNYKEGEAIALVTDKNVVDEITSRKDVLNDAEELSVIDTETYEEFTEDNADLLSMGEAAESGASVDDPTIVHISDSTKSTKELLKKLLSDDRVLMAEPNYMETLNWTSTVNEKKGNIVKQLINAAKYVTAKNIKEYISAKKKCSLDIPDLSSFQWAYDNKGKQYSSFLDSKMNFDMNPEHWNTYDKKNRPVTNATGVVCIFDSGVDFTNPDLANVMISDMKKYNKNGGNYGFDATTDSIKEPTDEIGHGTHCAGIVAAEWNKKGTSGIANGCKLCAVKINADGNIYIANAIRGYEYLCDAMDHGLNLVAVNNSWGGSGSAGSLFRLMITKLGEKGAITLFAAGNSKEDHDKIIDTSSSAVNHPYALVVNSCRANGEAAPESDYGKFTTDIYAPGDMILSTSATCDLRHYPILEKNPIAKELFHTNHSNIIFTKSSTFANSYKKALSQRISGKRDKKHGFEGNDSYRIRLSDMEVMKKTYDTYYDEDDSDIELEEAEEDASYSYYCTAYIPVKKADFTKDAFVSFSLLTDYEKGLNSAISFATKTGNQTEWRRIIFPGTDLFRRKWTSIEFSYANDLEDDEEPVLISVNKIYGLLPVRFEFSDADRFAVPDASVYFDAIGVVNHPAHYKYSSGTSMAAPAAAGAAAIIAYRQVKAGNNIFGSDAGTYALKRANILKGSVAHYDGQFEGKCTSGGILDLSLKEDQYTPVVNSLNWDDEKSQIILKGDFFGATKASVNLKGLDDVEVVSWSKQEIVLHTGIIPKTNLYEVTVKAKNGNSSNYRLLLETSDRENLFEGNIPLPDDKHVRSIADKMIMGGDGRYLYASFRDADTGLYSEIFVYDTESDQWVDQLKLPDMEKCDYVSIASDTENVYIYCSYCDRGNGTAGISNLYAYNRKTDQDLRKIEIENIPSYSSLVYTQGKLYFAAGGHYTKLEFDDSDLEFEDPDVEVENPGVETEDSDVEAEEPEVEVENPEVETEDSDVEVENPEVENPDVEVENPDFEEEDSNYDDEELPEIYLFDTEGKLWQIVSEESNQNKAVIEEVGDLDYFDVTPPAIAVTDDGFYMMGESYDEYHLQKVVIDNNEITVSDESGVIPEISEEYSVDRNYSITGVNGGIILSGLYMQEGTEAILDVDTYFLENGGSGFVPLDKRADTDLIQNTYTYAMKDRLYVCASGTNISSGLFIHYTEND